MSDAPPQLEGGNEKDFLFPLKVAKENPRLLFSSLSFSPSLPSPPVGKRATSAAWLFFFLFSLLHFPPKGGESGKVFLLHGASKLTPGTRKAKKERKIEMEGREKKVKGVMVVENL